jgi:EAL domain-containing protein (putative c-di-GMP-specific phosphodiesterase class I)
MEDLDTTTHTLFRLKDMGVRISIDDFGTGYSSLSYLKRFPIDELKIDRSFVAGLNDDADNLAIVRTIIALGKALKLDVVAEGVETEAQLEFLRAMGCDRAQGFLLGRPAPG